MWYVPTLKRAKSVLTSSLDVIGVVKEAAPLSEIVSKTSRTVNLIIATHIPLIHLFHRYRNET
jgi:hypothetical protein